VATATRRTKFLNISKRIIFFVDVMMAKKSFKTFEQPSKHFQNPHVSYLYVNISDMLSNYVNRDFDSYESNLPLYLCGYLCCT
jgi:hypothetical protein